MSSLPRSSIKLASILGLAITMSACSSDDDDPVDAGSPPADAGVQMTVDAAEPPADAGPLPAQDAGAPELDAGPPPAEDAGAPEMDAGPPPAEDAGEPEMDAGEPEIDAGEPEMDAGMAPADAGQGMPLMCDPEFGQTDACGGDPEGTWTYVEACGRTPISQGLEGQCPAVVINTETINNPVGSLSISGGTFNTTFTGEVLVTFEVPPQCVLGDCITTELALQAGVPGATATCTADGPSCDCEMQAPFTAASSGTLSLNGGVATVDTVGGQETYYFCVSGDELTYREFGTSAEEPVFLLNR